MRGFDLWAIRREALPAAVNADPRAAMAGRRGGDRLIDGSFARVIDGVAVIPVLGPLMNRMNLFYWSYGEIERDFTAALADERVRGILLDIDSPGGLVAGVDELSSLIRGSRGAKPTVAHVGGLGASAAYYVASAADEVVASRGAVVGSIGTLIRYMDIEGIFVRMGARIVEVVATQSPSKVLDPDSEEGRAEMQSIVDEMADNFIADLAANRGVSPETVLRDYGQGLVFPARQALERGLVDRVAGFNEILAELTGRRTEANGPEAVAAPTTSKDHVMDWLDIDVAGLAQNRPDIVKAIGERAVEAAGAGNEKAIAEARREGADGERARILALEEAAPDGYDDLVAAAKADPGQTAETLAVAILKKQKQDGAQHLEQRAKASDELNDLKSRASATGDAGAAAVPQTEDGWKAEWAASEKLRAEYVNAADYIAYRKAEARGGVKILTGRAAA
jgi:signal peptide peptidase SppA